MILTLMTINELEFVFSLIPKNLIIINKVFMKHLLCTLLLAYTIFFSNMIKVEAQLRSRSLSDTTDNNWYNYQNYQYEQSFSKLTTLPPLNSGMDFETMLSYIVLDSCLKNLDINQFNNLYLNRWLSSNQINDTAQSIIKYYYNLYDYNPILMKQYNQSCDSTYKYSLWNITNVTNKLINHYTKNKDSMEIIKLINESDYILKIKVNNIESINFIEYPNKSTYNSSYQYNVQATVLDTLKGKYYKNCNFQFNKNNIDKIQNNTNEICFTYSSFSTNYENSKYEYDPLILNGENLKLQNNDTLLVFLVVDSYYYDLNNDYFSVRINFVQPIKNNLLLDKKYLWNSTNSIEYNDFIVLFEKYLNYLRNGGY